MDIILKSINPSPPNGRKPVFRNLQEPFTGFYFLCNSGVKASLVCCGVVWCATSPLRCCVHTAWQAFLGGGGVLHSKVMSMVVALKTASVLFTIEQLQCIAPVVSEK